MLLNAFNIINVNGGRPTSSPEVTEMMLAMVYSVVMCSLGWEMCRSTLPWTMAPRMKLMWPTRMRVNPFFISLLAPLSLSENESDEEGDWVDSN